MAPRHACRLCVRERREARSVRLEPDPELHLLVAYQQGLTGDLGHRRFGHDGILQRDIQVLTVHPVRAWMSWPVLALLVCGIAAATPAAAILPMYHGEYALATRCLDQWRPRGRLACFAPILACCRACLEHSAAPCRAADFLESGG